MSHRRQPQASESRRQRNENRLRKLAEPNSSVSAFDPSLWAKRSQARLAPMVSDSLRGALKA
jgi:hypothetical protein